MTVLILRPHDFPRLIAGKRFIQLVTIIKYITKKCKLMLIIKDFKNGISIQNTLYHVDFVHIK